MLVFYIEIGKTNSVHWLFLGPLNYVYLHPEDNGLSLYQGLNKFFEFYNNEKTHQGIGRVPPANLYLEAA